MKKFLAVLLMLAMLLCGAAFAEDTAPALTKDVVVLFTSDVHCGIDQGWGYAGRGEYAQQPAGRQPCGACR